MQRWIGFARGLVGNVAFKDNISTQADISPTADEAKGAVGTPDLIDDMEDDIRNVGPQGNMGEMPDYTHNYHNCHYPCVEEVLTLHCRERKFALSLVLSEFITCNDIVNIILHFANPDLDVFSYGFSKNHERFLFAIDIEKEKQMMIQKYACLDAMYMSSCAHR